MKASFLTLFAFGCLLLSTTTLYLARYGGPAGWRVFTIDDASLSRTFPAHSLIVVRPINPIELQPGMIVSFRNPYRQAQIVTQRLEALHQVDKQSYVQTVGDNQKMSEGWNVPAASIIGRVVSHIPKAGNALTILQSVPGSLIFVILPILIIIATELKAIFEIVLRKRLRLAIRA